MKAEWTDDMEIKSMKRFKPGNCQALIQLEDRMKIPAVLIGEIFGRITIDPHVQFLDRMWYTGYRRHRLDPVPCPDHEIDE